MEKSKKLEIRLIKNQIEREAVFGIRRKVFIEGQRVSENIVIDKFEDQAEHIIVFLDEEPIGCARIRYIDGAKLERIAILPEYQNKGYGKKLMNFLINHCYNKRIYMNSQYYIKDYYKKFGFKEVGCIFIEAKIKHIRMVL